MTPVTVSGLPTLYEIVVRQAAVATTLIMFYKGQSIWDGRRDFGKNKGQSLAFLNCPFMVQGTKMHCLGKRHCEN